MVRELALKARNKHGPRSSILAAQREKRIHIEPRLQRLELVV
jgi:hypothetical protein